MKTRLRRWYWSSIRPGGWPLEYVGDPWEKLLGFLIAVVILAFYIGVVNLVLMFASFSLFQDNMAAYLLSFLGVLPLWFYATYRARRYVLARTRWRGLRFGLAPGAWGYTWRALLYWGLVLASLGLLWPLMTFRLEKYRTDRTYLGTQRLTQGGRWTMLLRPARGAYAVWALLAALTLWVVAVDPVVAWDWSEMAPEAGAGEGEDVALAWPGRLWLYLPLGLALLYAAIHYRVRARALMAGAKRAGGLGLVARPNPARIAFIYVVGNLLMWLILSLPMILFGAVIVALVMNYGDMAAADPIRALPRWMQVAVLATLYFTFFLLWQVLTHVLITLPVWRHYAATLTVTGTEALAGIGQRPRDRFEEAEGFAEALDVGAAI